MLGMDRMVFGSLVFWFGLILIPIATLIPDLVVTVVRNSAFKSATEAVRESELKQRAPPALLAQPRHSECRGEPVGLRWRRRHVQPAPAPPAPRPPWIRDAHVI